MAEPSEKEIITCKHPNAALSGAALGCLSERNERELGKPPTIEKSLGDSLRYIPGHTDHRNRNPMSRSAARQPRERETAGRLSSRERRIQGWVRIRFRKSDGQREGKPKKNGRSIFSRDRAGAFRRFRISIVSVRRFRRGTAVYANPPAGRGARQFRRMKSAAAKHRYRGERGAVLKQQHG